MPSSVEFVLSLVQSLVDQPEKVKARWVEAPGNGYVELDVPESERGRIIGKRGKTIQSIRQLATAVFGASGQEVGVEIRE